MSPFSVVPNFNVFKDFQFHLFFRNQWIYKVNVCTELRIKLNAFVNFIRLMIVYSKALDLVKNGSKIVPTGSQNKKLNSYELSFFYSRYLLINKIISIYSRWFGYLLKLARLDENRIITKTYEAAKTSCIGKNDQIDTSFQFLLIIALMAQKQNSLI